MLYEPLHYGLYSDLRGSKVGYGGVGKVDRQAVKSLEFELLMSS